MIPVLVVGLACLSADVDALLRDLDGGEKEASARAETALYELGDGAAPAVEKRLFDRLRDRPEVRRIARGWMLQIPPQDLISFKKTIGEKIDQLGSDDWDTREEANGWLQERGWLIRNSLLERIEDPDPEIRARIGDLLTTGRYGLPPKEFRIHQKTLKNYPGLPPMKRSDVVSQMAASLEDPRAFLLSILSNETDAAPLDQAFRRLADLAAKDRVAGLGILSRRCATRGPLRALGNILRSEKSFPALRVVLERAADQGLEFGAFERDLYAHALLSTGEAKRGVAEFLKAYPDPKSRPPAVSNRLVEELDRLGETAQLKKIAQQAAEHGRATEAVARRLPELTILSDPPEEAYRKLRAHYNSTGHRSFLGLTVALSIRAGTEKELLKEAMQLVESLDKKQPGYREAHLMERVLLVHRRHPELLELRERMSKWWPTDPIRLGVVQSIAQTGVLKRLKGTIEAYRIENVPTQRHQVLLIDRLARQGKREKADQAAFELRRASGRSESDHAQVARDFEARGRIDWARLEWKQVLVKEPHDSVEDVNALFAVSRLADLRGRPDEAKAYLSRGLQAYSRLKKKRDSVRLDGGNLERLTLRLQRIEADHLASRGKKELARKGYLKVSEKAPGDLPLQLLILRGLRSIGAKKDADRIRDRVREGLDRAIAARPTDPIAANARVRFGLETGEEAKTLEELSKKALGLAPYRLETRKSRLRVLAKSGMKEAAERFAREGLAIFPEERAFGASR